MRRAPSGTMIALILLWPVLPACKSGTNDNPPGGVELELAFPALTFIRPLALESPPDSSHRLFVVEQAGRIFVFPNDRNVKRPKLFLDIRKHVCGEGNMVAPPQRRGIGHIARDRVHAPADCVVRRGRRPGTLPLFV